MSESSRRRAQRWPYRRYGEYQRGLQATATQWLQGRGKPLDHRYPYILADRTLWPYNIILPEVAAYMDAEQQRRLALGEAFALHKYIHHGLSSQAMLFNLVGPLIVRNDLAPLRDAFADAGIAWPAGDLTASLEVTDRTVFGEDSGQPTSIDLVIAGSAGRPALYVEAKLSETSFGGCSVFEAGNCDGCNPANDLNTCYLHFIGRRYWTCLAEQGGLAGPIATSPVCLLANYYQFFRELLFAVAMGGSFVLIYDRRNPAFLRESPAAPRRGLLPFLTSLLPEALQARVHCISLQQIFAAICASGRHDDWTPEIARKYGV
jgi:POLQ-like helicase